MSDNNNWTLRHNNDEEYEEKTFPFYNKTIIFSVKPAERSETVLVFTDSASSGKTYSYKLKGSVDYAKKIAENTVKEFENIPVDCGDIDLFLRKTFSLRR